MARKPSCGKISKGLRKAVRDKERSKSRVRRFFLSRKIKKLNKQARKRSCGIAVI